MNNKGIIIAMTIALLVLAGSVYFVIKSKNTADKEPVYFDDGGIMLTPTQAPAETGASTDTNIDTELKSLDKDMGNAFEMDSDSDPTLGIN